MTVNSTVCQSCEDRRIAIACTNVARSHVTECGCFLYMLARRLSKETYNAQTTCAGHRHVSIIDSRVEDSTIYAYINYCHAINSLGCVAPERGYSGRSRASNLRGGYLITRGDVVYMTCKKHIETACRNNLAMCWERNYLQ